MKQNKEFKKIIEAHPKLINNDFIADLSKDLDRVKDISAISRSDGGKIIAKNLKDKTDAILLEIKRTYKTATRDELVSLFACYEAQKDLFDTFTGAFGLQKQLQDEIDKAIVDN